MKSGNEFVWIPCGIADNNGTGEEAADGKINYNAKRSDDWKTYQEYYNGGTWGDGQPNQNTIQESIKNNGGFYVARYEAGIPEEAPFYPNEKNNYKYYTATQGEDGITKNTKEDAYKPVSKKGVPAWNFISQTNAKTVAGNMISNNGLQSYLIDSHAWDTICRVIEKYDKSKSLIDSRKWGNYYNNETTKYENLNTLYAVYNNSSASVYEKGQVPAGPKGTGNDRLELSTGASDDFKAYNIYDLAGNMWEWTTENGTMATTKNENTEIPTIGTTDTDGTNAVIRGGSCHDSGSFYSVVNSDGNFNATSYVIYNVGFRVVLYLK